MRRRIQKYLPIVLIALMVQVFAPIGACWAAAMAAADPLGAAEICHDTGASASGQQGDQNGQHNGHGGACAACCLVSASAFVDTPKVDAFATPWRETAHVAWHDQAGGVCLSPTGSNAQARAPPQSM